MTKETILISEIFGPTIQGEGAMIGRPTVFVRTGGCDYRCSWCDTAHAVDKDFRHDWTPMHVEDIMAEIKRLSGDKHLMVTLSGGNPAIQPFKSLIDLGHRSRYRFALETQGSIAQDWFFDLDVLTLSPKPPSSGMKTDWDVFDACLDAASYRPEVVLKFVVQDDDDYAFAREVSAKYPKYPAYIQPCNERVIGNGAEDKAQVISSEYLAERMRWLIAKTTADHWHNVHILPQLHVMIWGDKKGV